MLMNSKYLLLFSLTVGLVYPLEAAPNKKSKVSERPEVSQDMQIAEQQIDWDPAQPGMPAEPEQDQQPDGPSLQIQIKNEWPIAKGKFEIYVQAFSGKSRSKAVRIPVDSYNKRVRAVANFENISGEITAVEFAVSKPGNSLQHFCEGKFLKEGKVRGMPDEVLVILSEPHSHYFTADNELRNDAYPICAVGVRDNPPAEANNEAAPAKKQVKVSKGQKKNKK